MITTYQRALDVAYMAGHIDSASTTIAVQTVFRLGKPVYSLTMSIAGSSDETLEWMRKHFSCTYRKRGGQLVTRTGSISGGRWWLTSRVASHVLRETLSSLKSREAQAAAAIDFQDHMDACRKGCGVTITDEETIWREEMKDKITALNPRNVRKQAMTMAARS